MVKVKASYSLVYDVDELAADFIEWMDDYPLNVDALKEFILDRFISFEHGTIDVSTSGHRAINLELVEEE